MISMSRPLLATSLALLLTPALVACGPGSRNDSGDGTDNGDNDNSDNDDDVVFPDADIGPCAAMDIIFVIDDSGSMQEEQTNLAANFPQFAQVLADYRVGGQPLDFRVAVTTTGKDITTVIGPITDTEPGDNGEFRGGCNVDRRWLEPGDTNLNAALACRAAVGTGGPSFEMPLLTTEMSLSPPASTGINAGFLREDALLAVVIITDEDDCSRRDSSFTVGAFDDPCTQAGAPIVLPEDTIAFLDQVKGGRGRWATAVIAAPSSCSSAFGDAVEARKLKNFVNLINTTGPQNGVFTSICTGDLAPALASALDTFQTACETFPPID